MKNGINKTTFNGIEVGGENSWKFDGFVDDLLTGEEVSFTGMHKIEESKEIFNVGDFTSIFYDGMKYNAVITSIEKEKTK